MKPFEEYIFDNDIKALLNFIFENQTRRHTKNEYNLYMLYLFLQYYKDNQKFLFNINNWYVNQNLLTLQCVYDHIRNKGFRKIIIEKRLELPSYYKSLLNALELLPLHKLKGGLCVGKLLNSGYIENRDAYTSDFDILIRKIPKDKNTVIAIINQ